MIITKYVIQMQNIKWHLPIVMDGQALFSIFA